MLMTACHDGRAPTNAAANSATSSGTAETTSPASPTTAAPTCAVAGEITRITVQSTVLATPIRVSIVSPKATTESRGVLYLFHGGATDETQWEAIGVQTALDDLVAADESRPFAVVLPDLPKSGDSSVDGAAFLDDIMPAVERCLGTSPNSRRAIGGISRGGTVALELAAGHGDQFVAVGGHSPAVADVDQAPITQGLASTHLPVWLDVGAEDALLPATQQLASALTDAGASPELHVSAGGHDRTYWGAHLHDYLQWYASAISS